MERAITFVVAGKMTISRTKSNVVMDTHGIVIKDGNRTMANRNTRMERAVKVGDRVLVKHGE